MAKNFKTGTNRRSEKGVVLFLAVSSLVMAIPMVGLTVDIGLLYASKTRLQAAVDGAALAAARALNLGIDTAAQADSAKQNAVNWFYSNFQPGNWFTQSTVMDASTVKVYDHPQNSNLRMVEIKATTNVPTFFMKWFNFNGTVITVEGTASRRDVVVMMVLDRSSSMQQTNSCGDLKAAAKLFTGQFAAGRDRIGMVSYSDGVGPVYSPSTDFRTTLGFDTGSSSGNGAIDQITCLGGTGTAAAITVGYNELYKTGLAGAYNILLIETDGLPNSLSFNFWDSTATDPNKSMFGTFSTTGNGCGDTGARTRSQAVSSVPGWGNDSRRKDWYLAAAGASKNFGGFLGTIGPGTIGTIYSNDPPANSNTSFLAMASPWHPTQNMGINGTPEFGATDSSYSKNMVATCRFNDDVNSNENDLTDFKYLPRTDLFGNDVVPANNYLPVTLVNPNPSGTNISTTQNNTATGTKYMQFRDGTTPNKWTNYHNAALNASDHAAFRARAGHGGNIPATVFVIGLGGNGTGAATPDYKLMQRWANDGAADQFNSPALYNTYTMPATFNSQPKGQLVFSSDKNDLRRAFLSLSSQILRLSQ